MLIYMFFKSEFLIKYMSKFYQVSLISLVLILLVSACVGSVKKTTHFSTKVPEGYEVRELPSKDAEKLLPVVESGLSMRWGNILYNNSEVGVEISLSCIDVDTCSKSFFRAWGYEPTSLNVTEKTIKIDSDEIIESNISDTMYCYYAGYSPLPKSDPRRKEIQFFFVCAKKEHKEIALSIIRDLLVKS